MTEKIAMSRHLVEDRMDRAVFIALTIGFGEIIAEKLIEDSKTMCVTDTGVIIIKSSEGMVITMYIATIAQLAYVTNGNAPNWLYDKVRSNMKKKLHKLSERA